MKLLPLAVLALASASVLSHSASCRQSPVAHSATNLHTDTTSPVVVAYVTSWSRDLPDPSLMTHINYAFGHVAPTFDAVTVDNEARLKTLVGLRERNPRLKVVLSVGGWGSGNFSEMAADSTNRRRFAADCLIKVKALDLDGIDIDWEYPTEGAGAGISSSPADTDNFTLLMRDLRAALGPDRTLTLATVWNASYIDFPSIMPYVDFVNIMAYDMSPAAGGHPHNPLYASLSAGNHTADSAFRAHLNAGVPPSKLVLGLPFYGRGTGPYPDFMDFKDLRRLPGSIEVWDTTALVPYMADSLSGKMLLGFENPRSLAHKLHYIRRQGMHGAMYWEYSGSPLLARQVADSILRR